MVIRDLSLLHRCFRSHTSSKTLRAKAYVIVNGGLFLPIPPEVASRPPGEDVTKVRRPILVFHFDCSFMPAGIFRDDSLWIRLPPECLAVSRRHYFACHAIDITNPASQRLDCRCAPESLGIAELRTIAILMLDDLTP